MCAACRAHTEVKLYRRVCTRALCLLPNWSGRPRGGNPRRRQGRHRSRKPGRAVMRVFVVTQISWLRCSDTLHDSRCRAARVCHEGGAGLSPCARNTIREAISRDTSSSQHAGHAARRNRTRSAAGTFSGHRQRSRRIRHQKCGCRLSPTTSGSREEHARTRARAIARRRGCFLGCVSCKFSHFKFGQQSSLFQDISGFLKNERKREKRRWERNIRIKFRPTERSLGGIQDGLAKAGPANRAALH